MTGNAILTDGVITLRDIAPADSALLHTWRNHAETRRMFRDDRALDHDSHSRFMRRYFEDAHGDYWWIVEASQVPVGTICLFHFSGDRRACEFGRFIVSPEHRGNGYGRRALRLAMDLARTLGVERMSCVVLSSNVRALGLYGSLGFTIAQTVEEGSRSFVLMETELTRT